MDGAHLCRAQRAGDGGRWNIDNIRFPSPAQFRLDLPQSTDKDGKTVGGPVNYKVTLGQQSGQIRCHLGAGFLMIALLELERGR